MKKKNIKEVFEEILAKLSEEFMDDLWKNARRRLWEFLKKILEGLSQIPWNHKRNAHGIFEKFPEKPPKKNWTNLKDFTKESVEELANKYPCEISEGISK